MAINCRLPKLRLFSVVFMAIVLAGCVLPPDGSSQTQKSDWPFYAENAYTHVRYLSEDIGPRPASTGKSELAAAYIADQFRSTGLETSRQTFEFEIYDVKMVEVQVVQPAVRNIQAEALIFSASGDITGELVNAGVGKPEDFARTDVRGKLALVRPKFYSCLVRTAGYSRSIEVDFGDFGGKCGA